MATITATKEIIVNADDHITCSCCSCKVHPLAVFPGGICVDCYEKTPAARAILTGEEIVGMFTGSINIK